jgi:hypothetical protein
MAPTKVTRDGSEAGPATAADNKERRKPVRRFRGDGPFSGLRREAASGDQRARERLLWHVQRRLEKGWRHNTIAKRLRMSLTEVGDLAHVIQAREFDPTPRLVRRPVQR